MALKAPAEKINTSLAMFLFANYELVYFFHFASSYDLNPFLPKKTEKQYSQLTEATRIAVSGYHMETMQQALKELIKKHQFEKEESIQELQKYLYLLRCALLHTEDELIARWEFNRKDPSAIEKRIVENLSTKGLTVKIPFHIQNNLVYYNEKSKNYKKLNFKIQLNKEKPKLVRLNERLIDKLRLLSFHVLMITRKKSRNTILEYLKKTHVNRSSKRP